MLSYLRIMHTKWNQLNSGTRRDEQSLDLLGEQGSTT